MFCRARDLDPVGEGERGGEHIEAEADVGRDVEEVAVRRVHDNGAVVGGEGHREHALAGLL